MREVNDVVEDMSSMTYDIALRMVEKGELGNSEFERIERARRMLQNDRTFIAYSLCIITNGRSKWGKTRARRHMRSSE